jgi:CRP/FNR family transcriptional regulator
MTSPNDRGDSFAYENLPRWPGRQSDICEPVEPRPLAAFFDSGKRQRWAKHEFLFRSGDAPSAVFKVTTGIVALSMARPSGERQILRFFLPGDVCGDLSDGGACSFDGEALTNEVVTCGFSRKHFDSFVAQNVAMATAVRVELAAALKQARLQMTAIAMLPSTARVANFLCDMQAAFEAHGPLTVAFHLPMTRNDIADYLGLRLETVSRAFTKLRQRRLIKLVDSETVVILDPAGIAAAARRPLAQFARPYRAGPR